jgi:YhgE/Pip-like protein
MSSTERPDSGAPEQEMRRVRASELLRTRRIWVLPITLASLFVAVMSVIYLGSVINPTAHLHGLPVRLVNEDTGATVDGRHVDLGASIADKLMKSGSVTSRLKLQPVTLSQAEAAMNKAGAYATLVIPATLTRSALLATGVPSSGGSAPAQAEVALQENQRLGSLGTGLAAGVITPAIEKISPHVGSELSTIATPAARANPVLAGRLADPITLKTSIYRPLPDHTALGLSAFYVALLTILSGFLGAVLVNSSIDAALGYATSEIGPHWKQKRPVAINRRQTFLTKWAIAALAAPLLTGILLLAAAAALGMHAPHVLLLWALCALTSLMIATGTLALIAAFGSLGQLLAMILLVYLSLASSGGTVPIQALPGVFNVVGHVEPLRQLLGGTRAILYFGARGDAGLTHALVVIAAELLFWGAVGLAVTSWYDHKKLDRISPDLLRYVEGAIDGAKERGAAEPGGV